MAKAKPKVSVILPVQAGDKHLSASIISVLSQTHRELELIIVNEAANSAAEDVVRSFINRDSRIKYYAHKKSTIGGARNIGIKVAEGEWIAYLDSDDMAATERFQKCLNFVYRIGNKCLVYGGWFNFKVDKDKLQITDYRSGYIDDFDVHRFQYMNQFTASTVMHHKDCIIKAGLFDESLECEEDWDMWLRIADDYPVYQMNEALAFRRLGTGGEYFKKKLPDKMIEDCRSYVTEKRIKKLLDAYSRDPDSELAKRIFFACLTIKDASLRKSVLERLESWRIFNTISRLVKTEPKQAFELLERHVNDKLISFLIREKMFDFNFPMADLTNEEFNYMKKVLESVIAS